MTTDTLETSPDDQEAGSTIDPATADRLAKLQARRRVGTPSSKTADTEVAPTPKRVRRRSPASSAKIVTTGAAATATLGLIALYGVAEQRSAAADSGDTFDPVTADANTGRLPTVAAVPPAAPTTPVAPSVVVIVVDGAADDSVITAAVESAVEGFDGTSPIVVGRVDERDASATKRPTDSTSAAIAEPIPVAVPTVVDLAVPAAPKPHAAPQASASAGAAAAPPAPASAPQATSDGS